ncbi:MAG: glycosyltransferase family A protein [Methylococcales bacterium]|nr:glycosyltransferase family A protein [Methylococcales bacterium]
MEFSIIIPTRNRPALLKLAVDSVIQQTFASVEIIVVNDGSEPHHEAAYNELAEGYKGQVKVLTLERSMNGHGPCYAINMGVAAAQGTYVGFLDDDDIWIDDDHLATAHENFTKTTADAYFTNQEAFKNGQPTSLQLWLATLEDQLKGKRAPDNGTYTVDIPELMVQGGFCHMNTALIRRSLYQAIKGMDENLRYEGERDFYYRLIDRANTLLYNPKITARHNIPDLKKSDNVSTSASELEKMLYRLNFLDKTLLFSKHPDLIKHAKQHKVYTLKQIVEILTKQAKHDLAFYYAKEVLLVGFTFKWLLYSGYLFQNALFAFKK